ncbi:uncharacterized protein LOC111072333 [Drosophila obscura]|uniref:uncharacterized protein LOC111072333 n=1 Tax=Drosophila obscura TaxID=7282 RepID=UPI001BB1E40A|nr:uncharacterized protein LOC111072333 [Drosophila obscura]
MATAQGTSCALVVVGVPLCTGNKYSPRLTMRRVFDTKCFRTEHYRHEIGNHYRDYQIQQHLHLRQKHPLAHRHQKRRHRQLFIRVAGLGLAAEASRMSISLAAPTYAQLRDVWPTSVQYFPRFDDTYAARGRATICSDDPPDETYNDAVRRIKRAQSFDQLKKLRRRHNTRTRNDVSGEDDGDSNGNGNGNGRSRSSDSGSRVIYNLNISNNQVESLQRQPHRGRLDFYTYLQLASGYYERGLHANIKYLESIGQRNAIRHTLQLQSQSSLSSPRVVLGTVDSSRERQAADQKLNARFFTLLKGLRRKAASSSRKRGKSCPPEPISVHIRPLKLAADKSCAGEAVVGECSSEIKRAVGPASRIMCDLYAQHRSQQHHSKSNNQKSTLDQLKIYEIIDNLSHLSLSDSISIDNPQLKLPQITLTDCTHKVALYSASFDIAAVNQLQIPIEARPLTRPPT